MAKTRYCEVCGEVIVGKGKKFCSDACRLEDRREKNREEAEERLRAEDRQVAGRWEYGEDDPYADDDEDFLYNSGSRNQFGDVIWLDKRVWRQ